jgi:hypothetical protein
VSAEAGYPLTDCADVEISGGMVGLDRPADTPCAGCPSPILPAPAPRMCVPIPMAGDGQRTVWWTVDEYHPGCWAAELRRSEAPS